MTKKRITIVFLIALTGFALYLCYLLFQPFLNPLLSALVIAIVFFPVHARMQLFLRKPGLAAMASTTLVTLIIIVPAIMISAAVTKEVSGLIALIDQKSAESGGLSPYINHLLERPMTWLGQYIDLSRFNLLDALRSRLEGLSRFLLAQFGNLLGSITSFAVDAVITLFTLFFLFREGRSMRRRVTAVLPLSADQVEKLFSGIENTIIGTVYGGLVVAAVQGGLIGIALWVFGIHSPVLWGVVAAFFALLPFVGTAVVWVPAAIYLLAAGHWIQALILVVWGAGIVGTIDNLLRPYLISGRVQMHTLLIFFAVFGGVNVFGFLGLFVGPVILAITITLLSMLRDEGRTWASTWREEAAVAALEEPQSQAEL
jgi:predicted PurR-regulated permease PerM